MSSSGHAPWPAQVFPRRHFVLLLVAGAGFGLVMVQLPGDLSRLLAVLMIGIPGALLVLNPQLRGFAVVLLISLLPLTGILKAVTGSRFAPLTFDIVLLAACLLFVAGGLLRAKLRMGVLDFWLGMLWLLAFVQIWNPNVPSLQAGIEGFRKFTFMSLAYYAGRHILIQRNQVRLHHLTLVIAGLVSLYGVKQFFVLWPLDLRMVDLATSAHVTFFMGGWIRPFSTLPGPFHLGLYMTITALLTTALLFRTLAGNSRRLLLTLFLLLQVGVLIMTRTKGNWAGFVFGLAVLLSFQSRSFLRSLLRTTCYLAALALFVAVFLLLSSGSVAQVLSEAVAAVFNPLQSPTFVFRIQLWQEEIVPALVAQPLLGYGTSSAGEGLHNLYEGTGSRFFFSHNLFLKVWLELGLAGLLLFLSIVSFSLATGIRQLISMRGDPHRTTYLTKQWALSVVSSFLMAGLVIPVLDAYPANYYFWLLLGTLSTTGRGARQ